MFISKTCSYAIRAAIYLAEFEGGKKYVPVKEISENLGISFHFLTKILQMLTARNLMVSFRGPNGGIALSKPASDISLQEIIEAIDGTALFEACLLSLERCDQAGPCRLHESWVKERERLKELFTSTSLQTIKDGSSRGDFLSRSRLELEPSEPDGTV
jgi:Rrf2 family iron-sulfur cluster assembly transcriptional regulator